MLEIEQKVADGVNGALDQAADMINQGIALYGWLNGTNIEFRIHVPDFSNGLFIAETPLEHQLSKMIGGAIVTAVVTSGVGELLSGLGGAAEAEELATVEAEAASGAEDIAGEGSQLCKGGGCFVAGTEVITGVNANGTFSQTPIILAKPQIAVCLQRRSGGIIAFWSCHVMLVVTVCPINPSLASDRAWKRRLGNESTSGTAPGRPWWNCWW